MLHELLVALYGFPGAIFIESSKEGSEDQDPMKELVTVNDHLPFVVPGDLGLHAELLKLGSCYRVLERFIRRHAGPFRSLYLAALANGLDDTLNDYRQVLRSLESEVLRDPDLDVAYFSYRLQSYKIMLPLLLDLVLKIQKATGITERTPAGNPSCRILDILLQASPPGLAEQRAIVKKLFSNTVRVFHRQLSSWLLYGILHDPHDEFFIVGSRSSVSSSENAQSTPYQLFSAEDVPETVFTLAIDKIPSFLPTSCAQHVLFAGEAVHMELRGSSNSSLSLELEQKFLVRLSSLSTGLQKESFIGPLIDLPELQCLVTDIRSFISRRMWGSLVEENQLVTFLSSVKDVALLGRGELFLAFIDNLNTLKSLNNVWQPNRGCISETVDPASLIYHGLLDQSPPTDENAIRALEFDVQAAFSSAARAVGLDDETLDERFRFSISLEPSDMEAIHGQDQTVWDRLHLAVVVPSALKMAFSHQVCRGYDRLFSYLATVRRTQLALQQYWAQQTSLWRRVCAPSQFRDPKQVHTRIDDSVTQSSKDLTQIQATITRRLLVRNYMAFFVENLLYFLQIDVIDAQFCHLLGRIQSEQEADSVQAAHEAFLAGLQAQALLFHPTAKPHILRLLSICRRYIRVACDEQNQLSPTELEEQLFQDFQDLSSTLFRCLSTSRVSGASASVGLEFGAKRFGQFAGQPTADLYQLLLRLDFNQFYSQSHGTWS